MTETIVQFFYFLNDILRVANPFLFIAATCIWVRLNWKIQNEMNRNYLRQYCIESQIDYLIDCKEMDREYIDHLRKIYSIFKEIK